MTPMPRSRAFAEALATTADLRPEDGSQETGETSPIASSVLAVAIFIASEIMLFGGLLSAFMILPEVASVSKYPISWRRTARRQQHAAPSFRPVKEGERPSMLWEIVAEQAGL